MIPQPFNQRVRHLMENYGLTIFQATDHVEKERESFNNHQEVQKQVHLKSTNVAQISLIAHMSTLATLTLTVAGFLSTQFAGGFNDNHKKILMGILISETLSLIFGVLDYSQSIRFHKSWAKTHYDIQEEVAEKFKKGDLQWIGDMIDIEDKYLKKQKSETSVFITRAMTFLVFLGQVLLIILFYSYFFNFPEERIESFMDSLSTSIGLILLMGLFIFFFRVINKGKVKND